MGQRAKFSGPSAESLQADADPLRRAQSAHRIERSLTDMARRYAAVREDAIAELVDSGGWTMGDLAIELGISKAMVQKLVERQRERKSQ